MFQVIFWISLVIVLGGLVWHYLAHPLAGGIACLMTAPANKRPWWCFWDQKLSWLGKLKRLAHLVALASVVLMALTSFLPRAVFSTAMSGYPLMLHVGLSPVFIGCVAFAIVTWAYQWRLDEADWKGICRLCRCQIKGSLDKPQLGCKLSFWLAALLAIPASLSMVLSMFPIFGSHGLELLFALHQYTGLGLTLFTIIHVYFALRLAGEAKKSSPKVKKS